MSDPESDKMNGSLIIVEAESAAAARAVMEKDIYWTGNVVSLSVHPLFLSPPSLVFPPASLS